MQQLDWSRIDLTEWVAEATLGGALPDGQDDLTLEALTGNGHVLAGGQDRDNTLERLNNRYESDKLINASKETQDLIQLENVDCSYMPRPAICKFQ
jgi:conjugal transfer mating pair stabilization protein TraN